MRKLSRYWLILMAASQSSTELNVLKSGIERSSSGWEGLERAKERHQRIDRERRGMKERDTSP